jgi:hypothetical protein
MEDNYNVTAKIKMQNKGFVPVSIRIYKDFIPQPPAWVEQSLIPPAPPS